MTTLSPHHLTVAEELLLLGLDPARSRPRVKMDHLRYGLAAAALAELEGYGSVAEERGRFVVLRPLPVGQPLLDRILGDLAAGPAGGANGKGKGERLQAWLRKYGRQAEQLAAASLAHRGAIRLTEHRALGLFPHRRYDVVDQQLHDQALAAFHGSLERGFPDRRSRALAGLLLATEVATRLDVSWRARRELRPLVREQWFAEAVRKQIYSDNAAAGGAG
ncbi:GOLPH3/VPS74 family protein [Streptomyces niger]|uniref:GOLPH3/VPS74 family protein n=1 Tax=Streptomyces niger TaxID=66373 RepID=UPI00069B8E71|nr:GPP34 family phosphoprotein [Streptomyces niger]